MTTALDDYTSTPSHDWARHERSKGAAAVFVSSALVAGVLTGTTMALPWRPDDAKDVLHPIGAGVFGAYANSTASGRLLVAAPSQPAPVLPSAAVLGDKDEVQWLKQHSGLTWDQLGKVLGVSRRAVHLWASGGRMNQGHAELLREFAASVRALEGATVEQTRAALLAVGTSGYSVVDEFRRRHSMRTSWGAPLAVEVMLGVGDGETSGAVQD